MVLFLIFGGIASFRISATSAASGTFAISASPTSATVAQGESTDYTITIAPSGYSGTVSLNVASCPSGATCTFDGEATKSVNITETSSVTLRIATSATGTPIGSFNNITVTGIDSVNQSLYASATMSLSVTQGKGFSLDTGSRTYSVAENGTGTISVTMDPFAEFAEDVTVTWGIRPANNGISFDPVSGSVKLTSGARSANVTVSAGAQTAGTYTLDFTGTSTSGITHTVNGVQLTVTSNDCVGGTACGDGQTCTTGGCKIDPVPTSKDCNFDACYTFDANGVQEFKNTSLAPVAPDGCWKSWPACQNVNVLRVRKDRQCNQWLGCKASIAGTVTQGDGISKLTEPQCTQLGVCAQLGPDGTCLQYINPGATKTNISFQTPSEVTGSNSLIRWYSGYSSGFRYSIDSIVANYPAATIGEAGLSGATSPDLVSNGNFEELRCLGGSRDRETCVVPSDCRIGSGVCVDQPELNGPVNVSSSFPCTSNKDCKNQKVNNTPVPNCRYLASWGGDVMCRNPFDTQWLGVLPPNTAWEEVGYGYTPGDSSYESDIQSGIRRQSTNDVALKWRVWEDDTNFSDQSGNIGTGGDPRFPPYSPFQHLKEGNNLLKVEVQPNAPQYSGVGVPLGQALTVDAQYTLSFKYRINVASGQTVVPIKAQIGLNYTRGTQGGASFHGYQKDTNDGFITIGTVGGTEGGQGGQTVCATNPSKTCTKNNECGGSQCVDTGSWQEFTMTSNPITTVNPGSVAVLEFVTATANGSSAFTYYIDDVSLKPVLNIGTVDAPQHTPPADSELFKLPRRCRLFPQISSPDCQYTTKDGTMFSGWRGYCLDKDPRNADLCLTWWPLDVLAGEGGIGGIPQGYTGPSPLFQCVEQGNGGMFADRSYKIGNGVYGQIESEARIDWNVATGHEVITQDGNDKKDSTVGSGVTIRLKDIERIDVLADLDSEAGTDQGWAFDNGESVQGASTFTRNGPYDTDKGSNGHGSRMIFTADLSQYNRVAQDNGFRISFDSWKNEGAGAGSFVHTVPWNSYYSSDCDDSIDNIPGTLDGANDSHTMAFLFHFSSADPNSATLDHVYMKLCDERGEALDGSQYFRFIIRARQSCNYVVQTVDNSRGMVQEKSWANRVKPLSAYIVPNVSIPYSADLAPFGSIAPPVAGTTPDGWGSWTPDGTFDAGIQVLDPASGSPRAGTPYSLESSPAFGQDKYCFDAAAPSEPVDNPTATTPDILTSNSCNSSTDITSCISTSDDSQCIGRVAKRCSGNPQQPCSTDTDCKGYGLCVGVRNTNNPVPPSGVVEDAAKTVGIGNLKHIFAKSFQCWSLNATLSNGTSGQIRLNYQSGCPALPNGGIWDAKTDGWPPCGAARSGDTLCYVAPKVTAMTVNGVASGTTSVSQNDQVTLKFNYAVDAEQLPARYMKVIWGNSNASPISCDDNAVGWLVAPTSPVVATTDYSSIGTGTFNPKVCVKDNWEEVSSEVFGGDLTVTP